MKVQATVLASALLVLAMAMPSSAQQQIQISPGDLPSQFLPPGRQRHIEIHANEDALAFKIEIANR